MLFYRLGKSNQTDQGDETEDMEMEGFDEEGLERERSEGKYPLFKPNLKNMYRFTVPPAVALLEYMTIGELNQTFADFFPNWDFSRGFLYL
jgi:hypothetical protein